MANDEKLAPLNWHGLQMDMEIDPKDLAFLKATTAVAHAEYSGTLEQQQAAHRQLDTAVAAFPPEEHPALNATAREQIDGQIYYLELHDKLELPHQEQQRLRR